MEKVFIASLGCSKNQVDSEVLLGLLTQHDFVLTSTLEEADVVIINTCAFIREAVQESIEAILEVAQIKGHGAINKLIVTGCLPQRYGKALIQSIPEVDLWAGSGDFHEIPRWLMKGGPQELISRPVYLYDHHSPRIITNTSHSAYVKIAEGCSHPCTFCLIPRLRGQFRSRDIDSVILETKKLVATGVVEVILVAQDTTAFRVDRGEEGGLSRLLKELLKIERLTWIRFLYSYPHPANFPPQLLDMVAGEQKICSYLDIPIQHIDDALLRRMGRKVSEKEMRSLIYRIKNEYPKIHLRTTLIVGFPGEGEDEFRRLLDFVREVEFTQLGVFKYSPEEGTKAFRMKSRIPSKVADERAAQIMELQQEISWKRNMGMIGSRIPVLVDGVSAEPEGLLQGRTSFQAPEVDGVVYIKNGMASTGEIITVQITEAGPYDLGGEISKDF